jgi:hypothetical protein
VVNITASEHLETYLRANEQLDLLWKLYVNQGKFAAASQVLAFIGSAPRAQLSQALV